MFTVCIDAGHGDRDVGAIGRNGLLERDVCLQVALKVRKHLEKHGVRVVMTRTSNNPGFPELRTSNLQHRCDIATQSRSDLFVSIHCDSFSDRLANGTTTFCFKKNSSAGKLAKSVQKNLVAAIGTRNRGVKEARYYVLRKTPMPAVLVELAFISNPSEERKLRDTSFQDKCARGITEGILEFLGVRCVNSNRPSGWAKEVWAWGKANKLTDGTRPKDALTREEAIAILHSYHYQKDRIK